MVLGLGLTGPSSSRGGLFAPDPQGGTPPVLSTASPPSASSLKVCSVTYIFITNHAINLLRRDSIPCIPVPRSTETSHIKNPSKSPYNVDGINEELEKKRITAACGRTSHAGLVHKAPIWPGCKSGPTPLTKGRKHL